MLVAARLWCTGALFETVHTQLLVTLPYTGASNFSRAASIRSLRRCRGMPTLYDGKPGHGLTVIGNGTALPDMMYDEAMMSWR